MLLPLWHLSLVQVFRLCVLPSPCCRGGGRQPALQRASTRSSQTGCLRKHQVCHSIPFHCNSCFATHSGTASTTQAKTGCKRVSAFLRSQPCSDFSVESSRVKLEYYWKCDINKHRLVKSNPLQAVCHLPLPAQLMSWRSACKLGPIFQ